MYFEARNKTLLHHSVRTKLSTSNQAVRYFEPIKNLNLMLVIINQHWTKVGKTNNNQRCKLMQFYHYFLMGLYFRAIWIATILLVIRSSDGKISPAMFLLKYNINVTWTSFFKVEYVGFCGARST